MKIWKIGIAAMAIAFVLPPFIEAADAKKTEENTVSQKVLSFNLEGLSDKGTKKWEVQGESAEAVTQDRVKLNNVVAKAYGNEAEATLTADTGMYDKSKNNVTLQENVRVVIENSNTSSMGAADFSNQFAGITGEKQKPDAGKPAGAKSRTVITCDEEAVFEYERNVAYFNKNVKVKSTDGDIDADRITINLDTATKKVKEIVAEGHVKITRDENVTYSEKATYNEGEKKVTLSGKPQLVIYHDEGAGKQFLGQ